MYDPQLPFPPIFGSNTQCVVMGISRQSFGIRAQRTFRSTGPGIRFQQTGEVALNQQVKDLIQKLGEAIHESVSESEHISGVVQEIREQGFDVLLMLEATIGLNEVSEETDIAASAEGSEIEDGTFTRNDLTFLKSLRITTEEHDAAGGTVSPDSTDA